MIIVFGFCFVPSMKVVKAIDLEIAPIGDTLDLGDAPAVEGIIDATKQVRNRICVNNRVYEVNAQNASEQSELNQYLAYIHAGALDIKNIIVDTHYQQNKMFHFDIVDTGVQCGIVEGDPGYGAYTFRTCPYYESGTEQPNIDEMTPVWNAERGVYEITFTGTQNVYAKKLANPKNGYDSSINYHDASSSYMNVTRRDANGNLVVDAAPGEAITVWFYVKGGPCDGSYLLGRDTGANALIPNPYKDAPICVNYKNNTTLPNLIVANKKESLVPECYSDTINANVVNESTIQEKIDNATRVNEIFSGLTTSTSTMQPLQCLFDTSQNYADSSKDSGYTYTSILPGTENNRFWVAQCTEKLVISYDEPKDVSKAGLGFGYNVSVKIERTCTPVMIEDPETVEAVQCAYRQSCWGGPDNHEGELTAGPNDEFESCIMACDGGQYTQDCSKQCLSSVYYGNDATLSTQTYFNTPILGTPIVQYQLTDEVVTNQSQAVVRKNPDGSPICMIGETSVDCSVGGVPALMWGFRASEDCMNGSVTPWELYGPRIGEGVSSCYITDASNVGVDCYGTCGGNTGHYATGNGYRCIIGGYGGGIDPETGQPDGKRAALCFTEHNVSFGFSSRCDSNFTDNPGVCYEVFTNESFDENWNRLGACTEDPEGYKEQMRQQAAKEKAAVEQAIKSFPSDMNTTEKIEAYIIDDVTGEITTYEDSNSSADTRFIKTVVDGGSSQSGDSYTISRTVYLQLDKAYVSKVEPGKVIYGEDAFKKLGSTNLNALTDEQREYWVTTTEGESLIKNYYYTNIYSTGVNRWADWPARNSEDPVSETDPDIEQNILVSFENLGTWQQWDTDLSCFYGIPKAGDTCDPETEDCGNDSDLNCNPEEEFCGTNGNREDSSVIDFAGNTFIYRPIDLTDPFVERDPRWNWSWKAENNLFNIDPVATLEEIQEKNESIYSQSHASVDFGHLTSLSGPSENNDDLDYEIVITRQGINAIRRYNASMDNRYLDYDMNCYINNEGFNVCQSNFLTDLSAREDIYLLKRGLAGCNNQADETTCERKY